MDSEIIINITDQGIVNMTDLRDFFKQLKPGRYMLMAKDARKRSLPQNNYYWGVVVPLIRAGLYEAGFDEVRTNDQAHAVIKRYHLKNEVVSTSTGHILEQDGSTTELTPVGFNEFIERVAKWAAEYLGIVIPSPNDQYMHFQDWEQYQLDNPE